MIDHGDKIILSLDMLYLLCRQGEYLGVILPYVLYFSMITFLKFCQNGCLAQLQFKEGRRQAERNLVSKWQIHSLSSPGNINNEYFFEKRIKRVLLRA